MRGEGHLGRPFHVVESEDGVMRVKVGEGVRKDASLSLFVFRVNDQTDHKQITNRTKIMLDMSAYESDNEIKIGII